MLMCLLVVLTLAAWQNCQSGFATLLLPQRKEALIAFLPLTKESGLNFTDNNGSIRPPSYSEKAYLIENGGPFQTGCYSVESDNNTKGGAMLARYDTMPNPSSFTVAFYFNSTAIHETAVISMQQKFSISFKPASSSLQMYGLRSSKFTPVLPPTLYPVKGEWMFFAFSYNATCHEVQPYSRALNEPSTTQHAPILFEILKRHVVKAVIVPLGYGWNDRGLILSMTERDQLSCVSLYADALSWEDVDKLSRVCQPWPQSTPLTPFDESYTILATTLETKTEKPDLREIIPQIEARADFAETSDSVMQSCTHFDASRATPPQKEAGKPIPIGIAFQIRSVREVSNIEEIISANAMLLMNWTIDTCPWGSSSVVSDSGINEEVQVANPEKIWLPKIRFVTAAYSNIYMKQMAVGDDFIITMETQQRNENRSFQFFWMREGSFMSTCALKLEKFPFDIQACTFEFSLQRDRSLIAFTDINFHLQQSAVDQTEWELMGTNSTIGELYFNGFVVSTGRFTVTLRRIPLYYMQNLFAPCAILGSLNLATFLIPPQETNRPAFSVTIVLALTVAQSEVLVHVPKKPRENLLSKYVQKLTWFSAGCVIYELFALWVSTSLYAGHPPTAKVKGRRFSLIQAFDLIGFLTALTAYFYINYAFVINLPEAVSSPLYSKILNFLRINVD